MSAADTDCSPTGRFTRSHGEWSVRLLINGAEVERYRIVRRHLSSVRDKISVTGNAKLLLNDTDIVQLQFKVEDGVFRRRKYKVCANGTVLHVERARVW